MKTTTTVGDVQAESRSAALRTVAIGASLIVYSAMLLYTGVHNYTLMIRGIPADLQIWAILGMVALEISAAALPIALHWWCHAPLQRYFALAFYGADLALLWLNVVLDFALTSGAAQPAWLQLYLFWGVPATPLLTGFGWSILWLLDPSQQERASIEALRVATKVTLASRMADAARTADINNLVEAAAQEQARLIIGQVLGSTPPALAMTPARSNGRVKYQLEEAGPTGETFQDPD